jgi:hypothetical protein
MNRRYIMLAVILIATLFLLQDRFGLNFGKGGNKNGNGNNNNKDNPLPKPLPDDVQLTYKGKKLQLTRHAECRMGCRYIKNPEIMEVLAQDYINKAKTRNDGDCPSFAYEGQSASGKNLRIVVADCETVAKLVTVIDLDTNHKCDCE